MEERWLSIKQVAPMIGKGEQTTTDYCNEGKFPRAHRPGGGKWVIPEGDVQAYLTGKPVVMAVAPPEASEAVKKIDEDVKIAEGERKLAVAKREAEAAKAGFDTAEAWDKAQVEFKDKEQELNEREQALENKEQMVLGMEAINKVKASELADKEEKDKQELLARINRIDQEDKKHKAVREAEDAKRQESHKKQLSTIDGLAQKIYNPPPQSISNRLQEQMITLLQPIMESYGLRPQFDKLSRYIPLADRYGTIGSKVAEEVRRKPEVSSDGATPENIRNCYKACVSVYKWMGQEPNYGYEFCRKSHATAQQLQGLVKDKGDEEITTHQEAILPLFQRFHMAFMAWAETYQNAKNGDWASVVDWLCKHAELLEAKLGVGVAEEDGNSPLRVP